MEIIQISQKLWYTNKKLDLTHNLEVQKKRRNCFLADEMMTTLTQWVSCER